MAARPTRTTNPICARISMGMPRRSRPVAEAEQTHRQDQHDGQRHHPALVLGASTRKTNRPARRRWRPSASPAAPPGGRGRSTRSRSRRAAPASQVRTSSRWPCPTTPRVGRAHDLGGRVEVVARHAVRGGLGLEGRDRADRDHLAAALRALSRAMSRLSPELFVGLDEDRIGAPDEVEVVDVLRADVELQGRETRRRASGRPSRPSGGRCRRRSRAAPALNSVNTPPNFPDLLAAATRSFVAIRERLGPCSPRSCTISLKPPAAPRPGRAAG